MDLSVVIPVYNERENLEILVDEIYTVLNTLRKSFEIIVIDDRSRDGTADLLKTLVNQRPYLKGIFLRRQCGQTGAIAAGFDHASGEIIITMDGDLQNDPRDIPLMIEKMTQGYDLITGWRSKRKDPFFRKMVSIFANKLIRYLTATEVHDLGCGIKAYQKEIAHELKLYGEMHRFIVPLAEQLGARVFEMQVNHRHRKFGKSKYGMGRISKVLIDLITVWFFRGFQTKPSYLFGGIAFTFGGMSIALSLFVLWEKVAHGTWVHKNPAFMIAMILGVMGVQFLGMGILAELIIRTYFESQKKPAYFVQKTIGFE